MQIINPSAELWTPKNHKQHVARCARVCYGKESGDDYKTINNLLIRNHISMFRHETYYYIIPFDKAIFYVTDISYYINIGYKIVGVNIKYDNNTNQYFVVTNGQFNIENENLINSIKNYEVDADTFRNTEIGYSMMRYTFALTTQISTSRELNRVSPNNIAEQSTRYVYENGTLCKPYWLNEYQPNKYNSTLYSNQIVQQYLDNCDSQFKNYKQLVDNGMHKQDARGVLPLDTATKVVYTYSVDEWKHIIMNRVHHITGKAHGNAVEVMTMVEDNLKELGYEFN